METRRKKQTLRQRQENLFTLILGDFMIAVENNYLSLPNNYFKDLNISPTAGHSISSNRSQFQCNYCETLLHKQYIPILHKFDQGELAFES